MENQGDISGAVNALREGAHLAEKNKMFWYWDRMAKIYETQKDWVSIRKIYHEVIRRHPEKSSDYWCKIADTYGSSLDWKCQLDVYLSAIAADPNNMQKYSEEICRFARSFTTRMLFSPAITILTAAMGRHGAKLAQYQKALATTYMAARQWDKALALYKALLEGPCAPEFVNCNDDLGHVYLALGDTAHALAVYYQNYLEEQANGDYSGLSSNGAPAHMLAGDFHSAIRLLKADITKSHSLYPDGTSDIYQDEKWDMYLAEVMMKNYFNLGLCYEALNRLEEARAAFSNALSAWQKFQKVNMVRAGVAIYRRYARPMMIYGYALEKLGRVEEAKCAYDAAEQIFEITTFVGDDESLVWEHEECKRALERVSVHSGGGGEMPSLLEEIGGMRLELRLSQSYRTGWPSFQERSEVPRYRSRSGYERMFYEGNG